MQKQVPTLGRLLVMVGFTLSCFGLLLFLWLAFGGPIPFQPKGYQLKVNFPDAANLAQQADVRISGVPVGKVVNTQLGPGNTTQATLQLDPRYSPIPRDARAILRQKTLLGETYVELTPGTKGNNLPDGGTLARAQVRPAVQLDEILRAFDAPTRAAFQEWQQSLAGALAGRGSDLNAAFGNLPGFTSSGTELLATLNAQTRAVQRLVRNTGVVFDALSARDGQLRSLITNTNAVFGTTAARNTALQATFVALPTFEHESTLTLNALSAFARNTNPLVTQLRPVAQELTPTLIALGNLAGPLNSLFINLNPLIDVSASGVNGLKSVLVDLPPLLGQLDPFLRQLNPVLSFIGLYKQELTAFFANATAATQAVSPSDGLHYLRQTNPSNVDSLAAFPHRIGSTRANAYAVPGAFAKGLAEGYQNNQCVPNNVPAAPTAALPAPPPPTVPTPPLVDRVKAFMFGGGPPVPAPPCNVQGKVPGFSTIFPQVKAAPR